MYDIEDGKTDSYTCLCYEFSFLKNFSRHTLFKLMRPVFYLTHTENKRYILFSGDYKKLTKTNGTTTRL